MGKRGNGEEGSIASSKDGRWGGGGGAPPARARGGGRAPPPPPAPVAISR